jgi:methylmalonyl-CoA mutase C-terminal domain/subunit
VVRDVGNDDWDDRIVPKVVIGCFGMDQHEAGALLAARTLIEAGAEVVYLGRFQLAQHFARAALDEDADVIGVSCHSWEYLPYTAELLRLLDGVAEPPAIVLGGSVITPADQEQLLADGVSAVVGPGAPKSDILAAVWAATERRRAVEQPASPGDQSLA